MPKLRFIFDFLRFFNWFFLCILINYLFENFFCRVKPLLVFCEVIKDVFNCLSGLRGLLFNIFREIFSLVNTFNNVITEEIDDVFRRSKFTMVWNAFNLWL